MKIGIIAGMWQAVPPPGYGGIERMVFNLATELQRLGEDVTLFAPKGSKFNGELVQISDDVFINSPGGFKNHLKCWFRILHSERCDIYHNHGRLWNVPFVINVLNRPCVQNIQSPIMPERIKIFQHYFSADKLQFVAVSYSQIRQKKLSPEYWNVVHTGIDIGHIPFFKNSQRNSYIAFIGRICPEKGTDIAIGIAHKSGIPLVIAGPVQPHYLEFFKREIEPKIDGKMINYIGEIDEIRQYDILGNALATLFPITWEEPFALLPIYSLAVGTPIIAFDRGSVREIIKDGLNGFIASSIDDACKRIKKISLINRVSCRKTVEKEFTSKIMAEKYRVIYSKLI